MMNLCIDCVHTQFSAQKVAEVFALQTIATLRKTIVQPRSIDSHLATFNRVLIEVDFWHDTETSYQFIASMKREGKAILRAAEGHVWTVVPQDNARMFIDSLCDPFVKKTTLFREKKNNGTTVYSSKNQPAFSDGLTMFIEKMPDDGDLYMLLPLPFCAEQDDLQLFQFKPLISL